MTDTPIQKMTHELRGGDQLISGVGYGRKFAFVSPALILSIFATDNSGSNWGAEAYSKESDNDEHSYVIRYAVTGVLGTLQDEVIIKSGWRIAWDVIPGELSRNIARQNEYLRNGIDTLGNKGSQTISLSKGFWEDLWNRVRF